MSVKLITASLVSMINRFPNLVINDGIAERIAYAVRQWERALNGLRTPTGDGLGAVFVTAQDALQSAYGAFFDESLMDWLYFQVR